MKNNKFLSLNHMFRDRGTITLDDYIMVRQFFINIGYDTSKNIHNQFCKKYNLDCSYNEDRI